MKQNRYLIFVILFVVVLLSSCELPEEAIENNAPEIVGLSQVDYYENSAEPDWTTLVVATDQEDGTITITASMINTTNVDMTTVGSFIVEYSVGDSEGAIATFSITVNILPIIPVYAETIELIGPTTLVHEAGTAYVDQGAHAYDNVGDLTTYSVNGSVDVNTIGSYTLIYTSDFNPSITVTRTVSVQDNTAPTFTVSDLSFPIITTDTGLFGTTIVSGTTVSDWTDYIENPSDSFSPNLTMSIVSSNVDFYTVGDYSVTVRVTDEYNNTTSKTFNVNIHDIFNPVGPDIGTIITDVPIIGFRVNDIDSSAYTNIMYSVQLYNGESSAWETLNDYNNIPVTTEEIHITIDTEHTTSLYRLAVAFKNVETGVTYVNYSKANSLLYIFNDVSIDITDDTMNLSLNMSEQTGGSLTSVNVYLASNMSSVGSFTLTDLNALTFTGLSPETEYIIEFKFLNDIVYTFNLTTLELQPDEGELDAATMTALTNYITTFLSSYYFFAKSDEDFCLEFYYNDEVADTLNLVTSQQICRTYRHAAYNDGGINTPVDITYLFKTYSDDGSMAYRFNISIKWSGDQSLGGEGFHTHTIDIVPDETSIHGFKSYGYGASKSELAVVMQYEIDRYVLDTVTYLTSGSTSSTMCSELDFVGESDCKYNLLGIHEKTLVDYTYTIDFNLLPYFYFTFYLNMEDNNGNITTYEVPLAVSRQSYITHVEFYLETNIYYELVTYAGDKNEDIRLIETYINDYFTEAISNEDFIITYPNFFNVGTYRTVDLSNNQGYEIVDIVFQSYQQGYGAIYTAYVSNDGITTASTIAIKESNGIPVSFNILIRVFD